MIFKNFGGPISLGNSWVWWRFAQNPQTTNNLLMGPASLGGILSNLWISNEDMNAHVTYYCILLLQRISIWPVLKLGYSQSFFLLTLCLYLPFARPRKGKGQAACQPRGAGILGTWFIRWFTGTLNQLSRSVKAGMPTKRHLLTWRHSQTQIMQKTIFWSTNWWSIVTYQFWGW